MSRRDCGYEELRVKGKILGGGELCWVADGVLGPLEASGSGWETD